MKKYLLFLYLLFAISSQAQTIFKGQVIDEKTKETIPGVSIYVNNTTIGTTTDTNGKFALNVALKGAVELVASYVGYDKKILIIEKYDGGSLTISLKEQDNSLSEVVIKSTKGDGYDKWGDLFKKLLLGNDEHFVRNCKIINPEVLVFYLSNNASDLSVYAKSSLIVENEVTAYRIKIDFDNFNYNFNNEILQINYSTFFEDTNLLKSKFEAVDSWRKSAYYGSQMHFMRSIYNNTTAKNGFKIYLFRSQKNREKDRVALIIQNKLKTTNIQNTLNYDLRKLFSDKDTADYYKMVMKQRNVLAADTTLTAIRRFTKFDRSLNIMKFAIKDTIMVNYLAFVDKSNKNIDQQALKLWESQTPEKRFQGQATVMYFVEPIGANIQSSGYYPENNLYYYGKMFDRRISQLLPWDYDPDL